MDDNIEEVPTPQEIVQRLKGVPTPQEIMWALKAKGWTMATISKQTGVKQASLSQMKAGLYKNMGYIRYFTLKNLLAKKPPVKAPYKSKQYRKGFADGVASKENKNG